MNKCNFCPREIKNLGSLKFHIDRCKFNPERTKSVNLDILQSNGKIYGFKNNNTPWNKGLTKDTSATVKQYADKLKNRIGAPHSSETKEKLSLIAKARGLGGYVKGSGRGKQGWYKGYFCDSSYELAYVIYCLDHGLDIKRNTEIRKYVFEGIEKNYLPDFVVNDEIIEIKGFVTKQWQAKIDQNKDIKVLYKTDLEHIFKYVIQKYGKNYLELYEKHGE